MRARRGFLGSILARAPSGLALNADMVLVDLHREAVLRAETFFTKARAADRWFDGATVKGVPVMTLVRGAVVYDRGQILGAPGHGHFVRPG